jgi:hypothetical protein
MVHIPCPDSGNRFPSIRILCIVCRWHRRPVDFHTLGPKVEARSFTVKKGLYSSTAAFIDARSWPLLIMASSPFRTPGLRCILLGHEYVQHGIYRLTSTDLICPAHFSSELHHPAPYMFVPPDIPMSLHVSDCQILCCQPSLIPTRATLQPKVFTFFLLKKQFDRIPSTARSNSFHILAFKSQRPSRSIFIAIIPVFVR